MDDIEFVTAARSMFVGPELSGFGMHCQALRVAMAIAPDFGLRIFGPDERIVRRSAAVIAQSQNLTRVIREFLRSVLVMAFAHCEEEISVEKNQAAAIEIDLRSRHRR